MAKIFISYRRKDSAGYAGRLAESLVQKARHQVFIDVHIPVGHHFQQELENGVTGCDFVIALIGPSWLDMRDAEGTRRLDDPKDHLRLEIEAAIRRGVRLIPVLVGGAEVPPEDRLPEPLRALTHYQAVELSDERWDYDLARLARVFGGSGRERRTLLVVAALALVVLGVGYVALSLTKDSNAAGDGAHAARANPGASAEVLALRPEPPAKAAGNARPAAASPAGAPSAPSAVSPSSTPRLGAVAAPPPQDLPDHVPPAPKPVNVVAGSDHVWLYESASGQRMAFVEPKSARSELHFPGLRLFVGGQDRFEEVPIAKAELAGSEWIVGYEDVRTRGKPDGKLSVTEGKVVFECDGRREWPRVAADAAKRIVASTPFWDHSRQAFLLAFGRDSKGDYTLVDSGETGFSVFRGAPGKMRRIELVPFDGAERTYAGFVFPTPEGLLQADETPIATFKLTWKNGAVSEQLAELNPHKSWELIFGTLGIYAGGKYFAPCDD